MQWLAHYKRGRAEKCDCKFDVVFLLCAFAIFIVLLEKSIVDIYLFDKNENQWMTLSWRLCFSIVLVAFLVLKSLLGILGGLHI